MAFEVQIKNHKDGQMASVTPNGQLEVRAESNSQQHFVSHEFGQAYQVHGGTATLTAGTHTVLHIKNTDPERDLVISYIRVQLAGADVADATTDYFEFGFGREVSSGGTEATPVNLNKKVGSVASVTATAVNPTMSGAFESLEHWHPQASGLQNTFNKEGSIILGLNDTFEIRYISTSITGEARARVTFMLVEE
jgi:hypothetical protein